MLFSQPVLPPFISLLILYIHFIKKQHTFHIIKTKIDRFILSHSLSLGIPSLISKLSSGIVIIVFNMIILELQGNVGVAAYGIIANLSLVVVAVFTGIAQGIQPIVSSSHAMSNQQKSKQILKYALLTMTVFSIVIYTFIFFYSDIIIQLFNSEHNLLLEKVATQGLILYFTGCIFIGFNIIMSIFFTSIEKAKPAHFISLARGFLLIIPTAFLLSNLWNMNGVWLTLPISECIVSLFAFKLYHSSKSII